MLIVKKPGDAGAAHKLQEIGKWLDRHGLTVVVEQAVAHSEAKEFQPYDSEKHEVDLAITLGGDGTVLHLASLFKEDVPMPPTLSFAMGTLGFALSGNPNGTITRFQQIHNRSPFWNGHPIFGIRRP